MRPHMWHTYIHISYINTYIYTIHIYICMYEMEMPWMQITSETDFNESSKWLISFIVYKYSEEFTKLQNTFDLLTVQFEETIFADYENNRSTIYSM